MMGVGAFIGIDVAQATLDVAVRPTGKQWRVTHDAAAIERLVSQLRALDPQLIVLEATGGLELPLLAALGSAGLPVAAVNPRQVRDFAKATGKLAKQTSWTPRCWPTSLRRCGQQCGPCRIRPPRRSRPW
jgi:transposase